MKNRSPIQKQDLLLWVCVLFLLSACSEDPKEVELVPIASFTLDLNDPSGLTIDGDSLWVVSDSKKKAFEFTIVAEEVRTVSIDVSDIDGFEAVATDGDSLFFAIEETGEIIEAEIDGSDVVNRIQVADVSTENSGLEGLLVRPDGHILALKEKDPSQLIHLSPDGTEVTRTDLDFAPDVSGLSSLGEANCPEQLLVVSQESSTVYQITETGQVLEEWLIQAKRPEGIVYNDPWLYIVDEETEELLVFEFTGECR